MVVEANSLLIGACILRDPVGLAHALNSGADANALHGSGASALGLVAMHGDKACFYILWRAGARSLGTLDSPSRPAITIAAELGNDASVRLLLACEADPNSKSLSGAFAIDWARRIDPARRDNHDYRLSKMHCEKLLLAAGARNKPALSQKAFSCAHLQCKLNESASEFMRRLELEP